MAILGLTRLSAINRVLRGSGYERITTTPAASATTEERDAEIVLDEMTNLVLTMGWQENSENGKSFTPTGAGPTVGSGAGTGTSTADDNVAWTASTDTLLATSTIFSGYTFGAGDSIYIYPVATTSATIFEGFYEVASRPTTSSITLAARPSTSNDTFGVRAIGPLRVTLGSDILKIRSSFGSPNGHRSLVLNNTDVMYDGDRKTHDLQNDDDIFLDVTRDFTFENLAPELKEYIIAKSRVEFQRWKKKLEDRDQMLIQELAVMEASMPRNPLQVSNQVQPFNPTSAFLQTIGTTPNARQGQ